MADNTYQKFSATPPISKFGNSTSAPSKIPTIPPPGTTNKALKNVANASRPPLERASSVPEGRVINSTTSNNKQHHSSRCSIDRVYGSKTGHWSPNESSKEALANVKDKDHDRVKEKNTGTPDQHWQQRTSDSHGSLEKNRISVDLNNVPQIDEAITPHSSPIRDPVIHRFARALNKSVGSKRFPSLKLNRPRIESDNESGENTPGSRTDVHPVITITVDDDDSSMISDYLSPDKLFRSDISRGIQYIGDDVSLYGTPKEELSPLKEVDSKTSSSSYMKDQLIAFFQPSDNKLAMKLFGNKNALMKEKMRQKAAGNWVIHPCSNFR